MQKRGTISWISERRVHYFTDSHVSLSALVILEKQPNSAPNLVSVESVTMNFPIVKRYREMVLHPFRARRFFTALNSTNFTIRSGDRIAVLGPNGAGKTTLLKLIGGLLLPSKGKITVNGFDTLNNNTKARKSVGFVMNEERSFFWRLSAKQNLEFFAVLDELPETNISERCLELIRFVGLEEHADKPVAGYSSGMKQRLALARGLMSEPEILILDEPTRTLDPIACEDLVELINNRLHRDSRKTIFIATHRLEEAMKLCDRVMIINRGRILAFDRIDDVIAKGMTLSDYYRHHVTAETA
jgi:ABC-2 type transport system ATP-binding protein